MKLKGDLNFFLEKMCFFFVKSILSKSSRNKIYIKSVYVWKRGVNKTKKQRLITSIFTGSVNGGGGFGCDGDRLGAGNTTIRVEKTKEKYLKKKKSIYPLSKF